MLWIFSRFKHAGIVELLSTSGLGGKGTITKTLKGGDTKRAIYLYKILFEAFTRYKIEHPGNAPQSVMLKEVTKESIDNLIDQDSIKQLSQLIDMAKWIESFLDMVDLLLNMIHFQRSGNWPGFLEIVYEFLPYCFNQYR